MTAQGYRAQRGKGHETYPRELLQPTGGRMSARALGILVHLISRPDGWQTSAEKLARDFTEGRSAIETALQELEALGHLVRRKVRGDAGRIAWVWLYGEDPATVAEQAAVRLAHLSEVRHRGSITRFPGTGEPDTAEPSTDFQAS